MSSQQNLNTMQALTPVRSAWSVVANILMLVGGIIIAVGAFLLILALVIPSAVATFALVISGLSVMLPGVVLLFVAAGFRSYVNKKQNELEALKREGDSFKAEILGLHRYPGVHLGYQTAVYVECSFTNRDGTINYVKSQPLVHGKDYCAKGYTAWVYVNRFNPQEYAVEVLNSNIYEDGDRQWIN